MCAALRPLQPRHLSGGKFRIPSRPSRASMRCLYRPAWVSFFFFCLSPVSLSHLFLSGDETSFLSPGVGRCSPIRSQLGHTGPTGPVWGFAGVVSLLGPQNCSQALTRPSLVSPPFFPSLSRWKPGKQQICVHGNLPGAQSQDENLIGKKRFSLPWLSLASPHHFFSRPPSHFSNSVLRSLFFVYSTANFEAAYP